MNRIEIKFQLDIIIFFTKKKKKNLEVSRPTNFPRDTNTITVSNSSNVVARWHKIIILITTLDFRNTWFVLIYCRVRIRTMKISFKRHVCSSSFV